MTRFDLHVYLHAEPPAARVDQKLDTILTLLGALRSQEKHEMTVLTDIQAKQAELLTSVEAETDLVGSVQTLLESQNAQLVELARQLAEALAGNDPVALQSVLDAMRTITTTNEANRQRTIAALLANTPAAPPAQP